MTPLRQRMIEDMQLAGMSPQTQRRYVSAVRQLAAYYMRSPDQISEAELRDYFLYLKNDKHYSRAASTIALCGIKFFYEHTLKREWSTLTFVRAPRAQKLPVILSIEEVRTILAHLKLLRYRVCLGTIYACGLRLQEGTHLQVPESDSARMLGHGRGGTGATCSNRHRRAQPRRASVPCVHSRSAHLLVARRGCFGLIRRHSSRPGNAGDHRCRRGQCRLRCVSHRP